MATSIDEVITEDVDEAAKVVGEVVIDTRPTHHPLTARVLPEFWRLAWPAPQNLLHLL